jgi:hypothetical protein
MIPCFDIISILCDQLNGRLKTIEKFGPPKDMDQNFRTLIYAAPRMEIDELLQVRRQLEKILGKEFVLAADTDEEALNKVVSIKNLGKYGLFSHQISYFHFRLPQTSTLEFQRKEKKLRDSLKLPERGTLIISHHLKQLLHLEIIAIEKEWKTHLEAQLVITSLWIT